MLPSLKFENGKIKYPGGDVYFRKGTTVQLLGQPDLSLPPEKYTLKNIVIPREDNLISHFDFTNLTDFSKSEIIKDLKPNGTFIYNNSYIKPGLNRLENNILHGDTVSYNGNTDGVIILAGNQVLKDLINTSTSEVTFMMRFVASDLVNNVWNGLFHICSTSVAETHMHRCSLRRAITKNI